MKIEEFNPGYSFRIAGTSYGHLCHHLSSSRAFRLLVRRRFFGPSGCRAEFTFRDQKFKIDTDPWEYALWVITTDEQSHQPEMQALREHFEQHSTKRT
jgi:hypothetical protein